MTYYLSQDTEGCVFGAVCLSGSNRTQKLMEDFDYIFMKFF